MRDPEADRDAQRQARGVPTAFRHLALGFAVLVTILFTTALCSLPR
jgi:hypothetical protein